MKLVVDTNIIIAALIRDSMTRWLLTHLQDELMTIRFSKEEIEPYKPEILAKAKMKEAELDALIESLFDRIVIIDDTIVKQKMVAAGKIMDPIDPNDTPFIAAALATGADVWSDDAHFKRQGTVRVWKTRELVGRHRKLSDMADPD
ncbi:MAG: PIN domain-containing protein [Nanoarchaeota archaeon]